MQNLVPQLFLGGVSVIVGVVLIVESLKRLGFANEDAWLTSPRAALLTGVSLGAVALSSELFPAASTYIQTGATYVLGGIAAGLAYDFAGKAFIARMQSVVDALFGAE